MVLGRPNDERPRDVITIACSLFDGMAWGQPFASFVKGQAGKEAWLLCVRPGLSIDAILSKDGLNLVPERLVCDCRVFSRIAAAFMGDLAAIDAILQHQIKGAAGEFLAAASCPIRQYPQLAPDPCFF